MSLMSSSSASEGFTFVSGISPLFLQDGPVLLLVITFLSIYIASQGTIGNAYVSRHLAKLVFLFLF